MRSDLDQIKQFFASLQARVQPADPTRGKTTPVSDDPFRGSPQAKLTVIEFADYQRPFCGRHVRETLPRPEEEYINTGLIKYVFRDMPLRNHPYAFQAAEAANCAGEQERYWPMHDLLFTHQKNLAEENLLRLAQELELDMSQFGSCLEERRFESAIQGDLEDASRFSVTATPTFVIGRTPSEGQQMTVLQSLRGAQSFSQFKQVLDTLFKQQ